MPRTDLVGKSTVAKAGISISEVLADLVKLENPVTAAAVAAFIITLIPGTGLTSPTLVAIVAGVGVVAALVEKITGA
jgi:hypothetical protein